MGCGAQSKQREVNDSKVSDSEKDGSVESSPNNVTDKGAVTGGEKNDKADRRSGDWDQEGKPSPNRADDEAREKERVDSPKDGTRPPAKETVDSKADPRTDPRTTQQAPSDSRENGDPPRPSSTQRHRGDHLGDHNNHGPLESPAPHSGQSPRGGFERRTSQFNSSDRRATESTRSRTELMTNHSVAASEYDQPPLMTSSEIRKICNWVDDVCTASQQALPLPDVWGEISEKAIAILEEVEREKRARAAEREAERERRKRAAEIERASSVAQQTERSSLMADATELSQMGMTPAPSVNQSFREGE